MSWVSVRPAASVTVTVAVIASVVVSKSGASFRLNTPSTSICSKSPDTENINVSSASWSLAVIAPSSIAVWFSAALNSNTVDVIVGASFTSLIFIVIACVASLTLSLAVTVISKDAWASKSGAVVKAITPLLSIVKLSASVPLRL